VAPVECVQLEDVTPPQRKKPNPSAPRAAVSTIRTRSHHFIFYFLFSIFHLSFHTPRVRNEWKMINGNWKLENNLFPRVPLHPLLFFAFFACCSLCAFA
jgi:hypothetical protein